MFSMRKIMDKLFSSKIYNSSVVLREVEVSDYSINKK